MPFEVHYEDSATGYQWTAFFATEEEAMAQAVADGATYGGSQPQEIVDNEGVVVADQAAIEAAATDQS